MQIDMRKLISLAAAFVFACASFVAHPQTAMKLDPLEEAFARMQRAPGFDVSKPIQWGYFFVAAKKAPLVAVRRELELQGYSFVNERVDGSGEHWLQVSRLEVHSAFSLRARNLQLSELARKHIGVEYDGWDVTRQPK